MKRYIFLLLGFLAFATQSNAAAQKVLVVMSYHPDFPWHQETRAGIQEVLTTAEIRYVYLDTKKHLSQGDEQAARAYDLYRKFQPDGVIAADDNAQSMFVVPYLRNKVATPVVFCGVNNDAERYAYPAKNVTGVLEKKHYREGINLLLLMDPSIRRLGVIYRSTPSNQVNLRQLQQEAPQYPLEITDYVALKSVAEMRTALIDLATRVDALLVLNLEGLDSAQGVITAPQAIALLRKLWHRPTLGVSRWEVEAGLLAAVAKTGQEQGRLAAQMMQKIWAGARPDALPLTWNRHGLWTLNIDVAREQHLVLLPMVLLGADLVQAPGGP